MNKKAYILGSVILGILITSWFTGCIDFSYDEIAPRVDSTKLEANTTIAELKAIYPGKLLKLTDTSLYQKDSILIEGVVTTDDKSGNFYKSIVIQDNTGAIEVKINKTTLYNDYKLGQKVVIYCNGLFLGDYGGLIQLGSTYTENGVTEIGGLEGDVIIKKHIFRKGKTLFQLDPMDLTPANLTASNQSKLIRLNNVQFTLINSPIDGKPMTYADAINKVTINHSVNTCPATFSNVVLRTSGFAKFAGNAIPELNGTIVGILSYYKGTWQVMIRDTYDVQLTNPRCQ